jgi:hypothetical protein
VNYVIMLFIIYDKTRKAIQVANDDGDQRCWLPLSQVRIVNQSGDIVEVQMPWWLADARGLIV